MHPIGLPNTRKDKGEGKAKGSPNQSKVRLIFPKAVLQRRQMEAIVCLQKVCWFQVLKTNPLDIARSCSLSDRKISKCGNTSHTLPNFAGCKGATFSG